MAQPIVLRVELTGAVQEIISMLKDRLKSFFVVLPTGCPVSHPNSHIQDDYIRYCVELWQPLQCKHQ